MKMPTAQKAIGTAAARDERHARYTPGEQYAGDKVAGDIHERHEGSNNRRGVEPQALDLQRREEAHNSKPTARISTEAKRNGQRTAACRHGKHVMPDRLLLACRHRRQLPSRQRHRSRTPPTGWPRDIRQCRAGPAALPQRRAQIGPHRGQGRRHLADMERRNDAARDQQPDQSPVGPSLVAQYCTLVVMAPSTMKFTPVINEACFPARKTTGAATSCGVPIRPIGLRASVRL
jgi:hypothetical protein